MELTIRLGSPARPFSASTLFHRELENGEGGCERRSPTRDGIADRRSTAHRYHRKIGRPKRLGFIIPTLRKWLHQEEVQWVILGSGEARYQEALADLAHHAPHRLAVRLEFSEPLSHRIEAASDMFLMPSAYEPCGLNQLYSLRYGAVPVVHATGGLIDTVHDAHSVSFEDGTATGFAFHQYSAESLQGALSRACDVYRREPGLWTKLVENGMRQDWSWGESAKRYESVYAQVHEGISRRNA